MAPITRRLLRHRLLLFALGAGAGVLAALLLGLHPSSLLNVSLLVGAVALSLQSYLGSIIAGITLWIEGSWHTGDTITVNGSAAMQGRIRRQKLSCTILDQDGGGTLVCRNSLLLNSFVAVHAPLEVPHA